jgi:hypothetical protein
LIVKSSAPSSVQECPPEVTFANSGVGQRSRACEPLVDVVVVDVLVEVVLVDVGVVVDVVVDVVGVVVVEVVLVVGGGWHFNDGRQTFARSTALHARW